MEISLLSENCIKIKSKRGTIIVDPPSRGEAGPGKALRGKTPCDAVLLLKTHDFDDSKIEGQRVIIEGPGEYEVSGIKIAAGKHGEDLFYKMSIDGISTLLGTAAVLQMKDMPGLSNVVILHTDRQVDQSEVAGLEPNVALIYGQKGGESMGDGVKSSKFTVTREKLPEKMEIIVLQ